MKRNFTKKFLTVLLCFMTVLGMMFFVGCKPTVEPSDPTGPGGNEDPGGGEGPGGTTPPPVENKLFLFDQEMNPEYSSRTEALDTIFNPDVLGQMVLVFDRSEWNRHLEYCDYSIQHEDSVHAKGFYFTKDNKEWFFNDIGFRIRGNTSRIRPQEKNADGTNGKYVQAHFALDFEEWTDDDKKLADSMKGIILKRANNDSTYAREIYGYNLFRKNGIWIAPRAAYTTLKIQIIDDLDLDKDGDKTEFETVNFGVYGMIEEIKKQFLKERTSKEGGGELESNKGNLWKCLWQNRGSDFVKDNATSIGEEDVELEFDKDGKITGFRRTTYDYDYKGDNELAEGKEQLLDFMEELNNLPDCTDGNNDDDDIKIIKEFYTKKMDGDLFLRTQAINVILGMWDDYWINKNNFYFYFDKNGKAYFIPYDYDNILGTNGCDTDAATKNPLEWRNLSDNENKRPLIQKILQVPEFMDAFKSYLNQYSNENSYFDDDKSIAQITKWHNMIKDHIASNDLAYYTKLEDKPASWGTPYYPYTIYTSGKMNYFTVRQKAIKACLNPTENLTLTLNAGKGYFYTETEPVHTLTYKFKAGQTLEDILDKNNFNYWNVLEDDEKGIYYSYQDDDGIYYYPSNFIDEEGNEVNYWNAISLYEDTTYNTLYRKYVPITFDVNGENIDGDTSSELYLIEGYDLPEYVFNLETEDYILIGWTTTPNGDDFVTKTPNEETILYAKWVSKANIVLPYEFSEDFSKITFVFRPSDYNVSLSSTTNYDVYLMSSFTLPDGWPESACSDHNRLIKDSEGNYRITIDSTDVYHNWHGFQFCVKGSQWCGVKQYKQIVTSENIGGDNNDCFMVLFPESTITFDLNGGTSTAHIEDSYSTQYYISNNINDFFRWNVCYDNPTKDGFAFAGWTLTKDDDNFVDTIPFGKITVYAKWLEKQDLKLTLISDENSWFVKDDVDHEDLELPFTTGQTFNEIRGNNWFDVYTTDSSDGCYRYEYFDSNNDSVDWETPLIENTTVSVKTTFIPASAFYVGDSNDWRFEQMEDCNGGVYKITVTVEAGSSFKLTPNANWNEEWNDANLDLDNSSAAASLTKTEEFGKYKTTFAEAGTYTITMDTNTELYTVSRVF